MPGSLADRLQPFEHGDIFVGATLLNDSLDDHAGIGRIVQFDGNLVERAALRVEGTTHLVYGLTFAPDGVLWAFDPWQWLVVRVDPSGAQLPNRRFAERAFSMVHFPPDGSWIFTESLDGENQPEPLTTRHKPLPGHARKLGDGDLYRFSADGTLLAVYDPEVHGGMSGSMAVTHSAMTPDGRRLVYVSETGPRLMQFDLEAGEQLPDLQSHSEGRANMFFDLAMLADTTLLACRGDRVECIDAGGTTTRTYPLEGPGWSIICASWDERHAYVGNWFTGELIKLDLASGETLAAVKIAEKCMAGVAQFSQ